MRKTYRVELYKTTWKREWRWRIKADNGNIIAAATEGYKNRSDCETNIQLTHACLYNFLNEE